MRQSLLLATLFLAPVFSGCTTMQNDAGLFETTPAITSRMSYDAKRMWAQTKATLSRMTLDPIETDDDLYVAEAEIDGATVTCKVETYDVSQSTLKVHAQKLGFSNRPIAQMVFDKISADIDRANP